MKKRKRTQPQKGNLYYQQMWRLVDGAVYNAFSKHPDYLAPGISHKTVRISLNKRIIGAITGYVEQSTKRRSDH